MELEEEAVAAISALDGYSVKGSHIHVEVGFICLVLHHSPYQLSVVIHPKFRTAT